MSCPETAVSQAFIFVLLSVGKNAFWAPLEFFFTAVQQAALVPISSGTTSHMFSYASMVEQEAAWWWWVVVLQDLQGQYHR